MDFIETNFPFVLMDSESLAHSPIQRKDHTRMPFLQQIEFKCQEHVQDSQLCGVKFLDAAGSSFGVTASDMGEIILFSKQ